MFKSEFKYFGQVTKTFNYIGKGFGTVTIGVNISEATSPLPPAITLGDETVLGRSPDIGGRGVVTLTWRFVSSISFSSSGSVYNWQ